MKMAEEPVIYGFSGRQYDSESETYYYRARTYSPDTGRFLQKDPIGFRGGDLNLYRHAMNDPISRTDPSGLCSLAAIEGGAGGDSGYFNLNFSFGFIVGGNAGIAYDYNYGLFYPYAGFGLTTPPAGVSITYSPNYPTLGWSTNASGGYIIGGGGWYSSGTTGFEGGLFTPGGSIMENYTFDIYSY